MICPKCQSPIAPGALYCDVCSTPVSQAAAPAAYAPAAAPAPAAAAPQEKKGGSSCLLWGCVGAGCLGLLLLVLVAGGFGVYKFRDKLTGLVGGSSGGDAPAATAPDAGRSTPAAPAAGGADAPAAPTPAERRPTRVSLRWDKPVDVDLELWNAAGEAALFRASQKQPGCEDVTNGSGEEFFEFRRFGDDDYSTGSYVVSVYFAARQDESITDANVTLTVRRPDGGVETRRKTVYWERGTDQWHAFKIDAATGRIESIDRFINIRTTN